jgi:hypothetical protein
MAGFVVLAVLLCSIPGHAQNTEVTLHTVFTLGGTVNAVPKFTTSTHIGNSAISETGGNVTITGGMAAGGAVSGTTGSFSGAVTGTSFSTTGSGNFSGGITAGGTVSGFNASFSGSIFGSSISDGGNLFVTGSYFGTDSITTGSNSLATNALTLTNNSNNATVSITNHAASSGSNFTEAQFNNVQATFFTSTHGDTTAIGTKSAAVPMQDGTMVKVFSVESPEVWFEDYGADKLNGGAVTVTVDEKFAQTVNLAKGYHVFLTPKGDCKGLYVTNETETGFEVREMGGGGSNVEFDYRIVAHRKGYEDERLPVAVMPTLATPASK